MDTDRVLVANRRKLAFYAPMKSPRSRHPSGDRTIGTLFVKALTAAGFDVEIASDFRSWEGHGDLRAQEAIRAEAQRAVSALLQQYYPLPAQNRPVVWFSYHLYHKSPDWIGPRVCKELDIPYVCAEASVSPHQSSGPWQSGYQASLNAIRRARKIFNLNPRDLIALAETCGASDRIVSLTPFLDAVPPDPEKRNLHRQEIASRLCINPDRYWLLSVAMMREDAKLASYAQLAQVMDRMQRKDWRLLVVGDGAAEWQVRDGFRSLPDHRVHFLGRRERDFVLRLMSVSDLLLWPAIREAIGMVALEALAMGLPVICGRSGGIGQVVYHGQTGLLVDHPADMDSVNRFVETIESLLQRPGTLAHMSAESIRRYIQHHQIQQAAHTLRAHLLPLAL